MATSPTTMAMVRRPVLPGGQLPAARPAVSAWTPVSSVRQERTACDLREGCDYDCVTAAACWVAAGRER